MTEAKVESLLSTSRISGIFITPRPGQDSCFVVIKGFGDWFALLRQILQISGGWATWKLRHVCSLELCLMVELSEERALELTGQGVLKPPAQARKGVTEYHWQQLPSMGYQR